MHKSDSFYVALEGIDGSGKSTALGAIAQALEAEGLKVATMAYTAKTGLLGAIIRRLYGDTRPNAFMIRALRKSRMLQSLLYSTNAKVNLRRRDQECDIVLSDRSVLTGYASHVDRVPNWFLSVTEPRVTPEVVVYLQITPIGALERLKRRGREKYEEDLESLHRFAGDYEKVLRDRPRQLRGTVVIVIDAEREQDAVVSEAARVILSQYRRREHR